MEGPSRYLCKDSVFARTRRNDVSRLEVRREVGVVVKKYALKVMTSLGASWGGASWGLLTAGLLLLLGACGGTQSAQPTTPVSSLRSRGHPQYASLDILNPEDIESILRESSRTYRVRLDQRVSATPLVDVVRARSSRDIRRMDPFLEVFRAEGKLRLKSHTPDGDLEPLFEMASEAFAHRDFEAARRLYLQAVEVQPSYFKSYTYLGNTLYFLGRYVEAKAVFEKALKLNPFDYQAYLFLGDTLHQLGRYEQAKRVLTRAFVLNRENEVVQERLRSTLAKVDLTVRTARVTPSVSIEVAVGREIVIRLDREEGKRWYTFATCMACWIYEDGCKQRSTPEEDPLRLSMYRECLLNHVASVASFKEKHQPVALADSMLLAAVEDGYLEAIVFWEVIAFQAPAIMMLLPEGLRIEVEEYINRYVYESTKIVQGDSVGIASRARLALTRPSVDNTVR